MFQLKQLDPYRIERTEEYIPGAADNSYAEMIRVRGSKTEPPYFMVPSHLYKYSETEMGLYIHERKNLWRQLGKLLGIEIDISDPELMVHFPISMFTEVAKIVPFVRKRGSGTLSPEAIAKRDALNVKRHTDKMRQNGGIFEIKEPDGNSIPSLDSFAIKEGSD
jgi:hypothetical protein